MLFASTIICSLKLRPLTLSYLILSYLILSDLTLPYLTSIHVARPPFFLSLLNLCQTCPIFFIYSDRYVLKLFRDYMFHQALSDGAPVLDAGEWLAVAYSMLLNVPSIQMTCTYRAAS